MPRISQATAKKRGSKPDSAKGPKRTEEEALRDRADIARLRLDGLTQPEIAAEISKLRSYTINTSTVSNDLKEVRSLWTRNSLDAYEQTRAIELARLDQEERFAIEGWERSKRDKKKVKKSKKDRTEHGTNEEKPFEKFVEEHHSEEDFEDRVGDPSFLTLLRNIRKSRGEIQGFSAWQRSENINAAIMTLVAAGYIVRLPGELND